MENIILWGVGSHMMNIMSTHYIPVDVIELVVDSNPDYWGLDFFGVEVCDPRKISSGVSDSKLIVIATDRYYDQVVKRINDMGIRNNYILIDEYAKRFPAPNNNTFSIDWIMNSEREKYIKKCSEIPYEKLMHAKVFSNRMASLINVRCNGVVAEVGVAYGDFSNTLLQELKPVVFYAIDHFNTERKSIELWDRKDAIDVGLSHEEWYKHRFKEYIDSGKMKICKGMSWDCLESLEDYSLDYIYIDAAHDYASVKRDISMALNKVKDGGILQFNDYTCWDMYNCSFYGVIPAVKEMINEYDCEVLGYCLSSDGFADIQIRIHHQKG